MALLRTSITCLNSTQDSLCEQFLSSGLTRNFVEDHVFCPVDRHKTLNQYLFVMKHVQKCIELDYSRMWTVCLTCVLDDSRVHY